MGIHVRPARQDDLSDIARVHRRAFVAANSERIPGVVNAEFTDAAFLARWQARWQKQQEYILVAEVSGTVVGLLTVQVNASLPSAELTLLYVDPDHWHTGVGHELINALVTYCTDQHIKELIIWTATHSQQARAFYESSGAKLTGNTQCLRKHGIVMDQVEYTLCVSSYHNRCVWQAAWGTQAIGFHQATVNSDLLTYADQLGDLSKKRVLLPLCGKSLDLRWFAEQGSEVIGVEMNEQAVQQFFDEQGWVYQTEYLSPLPITVYQHDALSIYCGDFFVLSPSRIKSVDVIYDRAALVALPPTLRQRYVKQLLSFLALDGKLLLITITFDTPTQNKQPPYSLASHEVISLFSAYCHVTQLQEEALSELPAYLAHRQMTNVRRAIYLLTKHGASKPG